MLAVLLLDLNFNRHAVAVPARHILRIKTVELTCLDDHVFQDFVYRVPDMNVPVGVRRAIMQDELRATGRGFANALV